MKSQVYINWNRFVAECSADGCGDAREVQPGQVAESCVNGHRMQLDWPKNAPQVMATLADRPNQRNRNWFPEGHPLALMTGQPHGQSVAELKAEAKESAALAADKRQQVADAMAGLGLEFDPATGLVKGL